MIDKEEMEMTFCSEIEDLAEYAKDHLASGDFIEIETDADKTNIKNHLRNIKDKTENLLKILETLS